MMLDAHGFDWNIAGGAAFVAVALVTLAVTFWRLSPVGSATVQLLKDQLSAEQEARKSHEAMVAALTSQVAAQTSAAHDAELAAKDLEAQVAALNERPNTEQMLRTFETHHQENLQLARQGLETQQAILDVAARTLEGVGALIDREKE